MEELYEYEMNDEEKEKINRLNKKILEKLNIAYNGDIRASYIKSIGFILISKGYVIMDDGMEITHYFLKGKAKTIFGANIVAFKLAK